MRYLPIGAGSLLVLLLACGKEPSPQRVVARVGDVVLTEKEVEAYLAAGANGELSTAQRSQVIDKWIQRELLYREALRRRLDQQAHIQALLEQARRDLLIAALLEEEVAVQTPQIDEVAIQQYYQQHLADFQRPSAEIRARHILLNSQRDANLKWHLLQRGEPFDKIAREYSLDPESRFEGGELGYFSRTQEPILWEVCQTLPLNQLSTPIHTEYGYHLIQVLDRQEAGTIRPLEEVRSQVVEALVRQQYQEKLAQLIAQLKTMEDWSIAESPAADVP